MSRWVSSKLTSVSDGASPGQAFYHRSSIIRSHSKTHKETDSKAAASQNKKKNRGREAEPPAAALLLAAAMLLLGFQIESAEDANVVDLAVCFLVPRTLIFSRGVRINFPEDGRSERIVFTGFVCEAWHNKKKSTFTLTEISI